ncbi:ABC transporter permease [Desulfovibrio cuneatus]|uniref:ABC transporter permease n=1 Tax=Desulfovibrio cuneatus TaxID=159728 RepID=UPI0003FD3897|nr:ABC transporter permease subunit [Desulfovibrio cuneatus]
MRQGQLFRVTSIGVTWFWLGVFALLPNIALLLVAFLDKGETDFFIPVFTLNNFEELFSPIFLTVLWDTVRLAVASTLVCLAAGYPFAYAVAKASPRRRPWLLLLVIIPFWTNSLIRTYALILIIGAQGMMNKALMALGLIASPIEVMYTDLAVFIGLTYTFLPFMVLPLYASIEKLDPRLVDAAKDLGASSLRAFWHVTLPLTLPGIVAGCMLVFLPALGCFYVPEVLGGATNMLLGTFIKNQFLVANNWPLGAAASSVMTLLLIALALVYRTVNRRISGRERRGDMFVSGVEGGA